MKKINIEQRKKIAVDILLYIDSICKKNNIKYSLFAGTALGAIRHKGFIPWDDDLDIVLTNSDYKKLIKILKKQDRYNFLEPYEGDFNLFFCKLCDKRTIVTLDGFRAQTKMGVWVDIFPINNLGNTRMECVRFIKKCRHNFRMIAAFGYQEKYYSSNTLIKRIIKSIVYLPYKIYYGFNYEKKKRKALQFMESKNDSKTQYIGCNSMDGTHDIFPRHIFEEYTEVEFEGHKFPICKYYDEYLTIRYGDYMTPPPKEEQVYKHVGDYYWREGYEPKED